MAAHYSQLKSLAESLFARRALDVVGRMDDWAAGQDGKYSIFHIDSAHFLLSAFFRTAGS